MAGRTVTDEDKAIGTKIRFLRKSRQMSQTTLGEGVGVAFQQIQKYERGANRISASTLLAMADFFQVDIGYFFPDRQPNKNEIQDAVLSFLAEDYAKEVVTMFGSVPEKVKKQIVDLMSTWSDSNSENEQEAA